MRRAAATIGLLAGLCLGTTAGSALAQTVGIVAPLSGPMQILGRQVETGGRLAASALKLNVVVADDACTEEGGKAAAEALISAKVTAVVGFLCNEAAIAALPLLKDAGIPAITLGVRANGLTDTREKTDWPVYRLGPRADSERDAVGTLMTRLWRDELFAIVDDGTIYGRELAESFRAAAEQAGLKAVMVDTFRPAMENQVGLVGRLRRSGATHVFVGGDADDIAIMARDAKGMGASMTFAGGETLRMPTGTAAIAPGTIMIGLPDLAEAAPASVARRFRTADIIPEGYMLPAYAGVEIVAQAGKSSADALKTLGTETFETAVGPIRFDTKGDLADNPFRTFRFDGSTFIPLEDQ
ncbi:branched-chain amino acid ABC transporter substrate-binding protein [Oryzicola mucosus]|uniref:Branched-chain amino acid ABC transporter substrate-binding protein n=1 Tax=Oryzicola mucosus TaxID=2767425 RepID=A0A8J6PNC0_9HYPH|nr:branched-chain amino acid ABC transporter substrate-binding protein [Oryzicola mucosus]MBD0416616.1 branched-chain amino acid ABC transporter substrate-binding protein [Oryzicola mucosus]